MSEVSTTAGSDGRDLERSCRSCRVLRARPTKAKTYLVENYVFCVLEDILTTVERTLVNSEEEDLVREVAADLPGGGRRPLHPPSRRSSAGAS